MLSAVLRRVRLLAAAWVIGLGPSASWAQPKTIFVVESYHETLSWDQEYKQALSHRLANRYRIASFAMDTKRLPESRHKGMADKALAHILKQKPALVVLGDDAALMLLGPRIEKLGIPGVYLGINNNPRIYGRFVNITGVLERPLMKRNTVLVREMVPGIRKILVLFDRSDISQVIFREEFASSPSYTIGGVQVDLKMVDSLETWQQTVASASANGYGAIVTGLYLSVRDRDGLVVEENRMITWTSANTPVPLFCFWDWQAGADKAIGGLVLSANAQGKAAADIITQVLEHGVKPTAIFPGSPSKANTSSAGPSSNASSSSLRPRLPNALASSIEHNAHDPFKPRSYRQLNCPTRP